MPETRPPVVLPTPHAMLQTKLGDLPGWSLVVTCRCRGFPVHVPLAPIAADRGGRMTLEMVIAQLRCQRCGQRPGQVEGSRGDPFGTRPWRVRLVP